tara:strand:+ start:891 stop:1772 length:882 start_codon:yes stop_codon:yes gene_type:complete
MINFHKILRFKINILLFLTLNLLSSCSIFNSKQVKIISNSFSGKAIYFAELDKDFKKTKNFSKIWSKLYSKRFRSYHKFLDKEFTIIGESNIMKQNYMIIKDKKGKQYKALIKRDFKGNWILPSYLFFKEDYLYAKKLIGQNIWLNYVNDSKVFFTYSDYNFTRFNIVKVIDIIKFSDNNYLAPIWLKVESNEGFEGFLRFSKTKDNVGFEDHYFINNPLPKNWEKSIIDLILKGEVKIGMNEQQLRRSIGNPDIINVTSSRHGLSEQWMYKKLNSGSVSYQFEYGKLVYVSN